MKDPIVSFCGFLLGISMIAALLVADSQARRLDKKKASFDGLRYPFIYYIHVCLPRRMKFIFYSIWLLLVLGIIFSLLRGCHANLSKSDMAVPAMFSGKIIGGTPMPRPTSSLGSRHSGQA
jgi:hypothetical protein